MKFKSVEDRNNFLIETQERTAYNALQAYPRYVSKYGRGSALFELKYNFRLTDEELLWIIDKCVKKGIMDEEDKKYNMEQLGLSE